MDGEQKNKKIVEIQEKDKELWIDRVTQKHNDMVERKKEAQRAKSIDLSKRDEGRIKKIQNDNMEYLERAKDAKVFINNDFKSKIPYFARNILLVAGETGEGKSTTCANLVFHALKQNQKVLVISNEENVGDIYNRVTCLFKKWSYSNHEKFTSEQRSTFNKYIELLSHRLIVVDDAYNGSLGQTTTVEGIETILNSLLEKETKFDVIIIDYYQNIDRSIEAPSKKDWEVQARIAKFLDQFKNVYDAPIIVLAQKKQNSDNMSFKESIEGRKIILNVATCAIEIKADFENRRTAWTIKKSRFPEAIGEVIYTGYYRGKYVPYDSAFQNQVQLWKQEESTVKLRKEVGVTNNNIGGKDGNQKD